MIETASLNEIVVGLAGFDAAHASGWLAVPTGRVADHGAVDDA